VRGKATKQKKKKKRRERRGRRGNERYRLVKLRQKAAEMSERNRTSAAPETWAEAKT
jgi:hypothetical protein